MAMFEGPIDNAYVKDIIVTIGEDFSETVEFVEADEVTPYEFTGWSAVGQCRANSKLTSTLLFEFDLDDFDFDGGIFPYKLARAVTAALDPTVKTGVYSIVFTDLAGFAQTYIRGDVTINTQPTDVDA